jgi:hypothetical protein
MLGLNPLLKRAIKNGGITAKQGGKSQYKLADIVSREPVIKPPLLLQPAPVATGTPFRRHYPAFSIGEAPFQALQTD